MDMPSSCDECRLASLVGRSEVMCAIDRMATIKYEDACKDKPDWCPLHELPKKKEDNSANTESFACFKLGYNACIDELFKGEEDGSRA